MDRWAAVTLLAAALAAAGCRPEPAAEPRLTHGATSLEALGDSVWRAIVAGDAPTLTRMRVTEYEHNQLMWPEMPASAPEANFPVEMAWQNIQTRNRAALADLGSAYGGSDLQLEETRCHGDPRAFGSFEALTGCVLHLTGPGGEPHRLEAFRYVVVMDGRYKVVRYYGAG